MITRKEYVKELKTRLDTLNNSIDKIEYKAKSVKENSKVKLQGMIKDLREKRDSAFSKIQELKNTSEETWQDLKQGTENVLNSLKDALSKTIMHFKNKKVL